MTKNSKNSRKNTSHQVAKIGLWISIIGLLALVVLLVLKLIIFMGMYTPPNIKPVNLALWISIGVLMLGPAWYALLAPQKVREFLTGRQARHGSNALILFIAFIMILFVVNALVYKNPIDWDWTEGKQNTLAPETMDALVALPSPVNAIGFFTARSSSTSSEELMAKFRDNSDGKFTYQIVDPDQNPVLAQQYGVTGDSTTVLVLEDRHETLTYATEQELTNALIRLMNPGERTVYFLTGHGEFDITGSGDQGYSKVRTVLEAKNYSVSTLNLRAENTIPENALALIIAGPTEPISAEEMPLLAEYLADGGSLVLLAEPLTTTSVNDPMLNYLATTWGVSASSDLVVDPSSSQPWIAVANSYSVHSITEKLENVITFFPTARSLSTDANLQGLTSTPLILTSTAAWGETDLASIETDQVSYDPAVDVSGPILLAVSVENVTTAGRLVIVGDSDFASDTSFDQYGNGDLILNIIDWAAGQENLINLTAKAPVTRQLNIPSTATILILAFSFVCLIPGIVVAGGITSWLIRRSKG